MGCRVTQLHSHKAPLHAKCKMHSHCLPDWLGGAPWRSSRRVASAPESTAPNRTSNHSMIDLSSSEHRPLRQQSKTAHQCTTGFAVLPVTAGQGIA